MRSSSHSFLSPCPTSPGQDPTTPLLSPPWSRRCGPWLLLGVGLYASDVPHQRQGQVLDPHWAHGVRDRDSDYPVHTGRSAHHRPVVTTDTKTTTAPRDPFPPQVTPAKDHRPVPHLSGTPVSPTTRATCSCPFRPTVPPLPRGRQEVLTPSRGRVVRLFGSGEFRQRAGPLQDSFRRRPVVPTVTAEWLKKEVTTLGWTHPSFRCPPQGLKGNTTSE